jgi:hypothetical protein
VAQRGNSIFECGASRIHSISEEQRSVAGVEILLPQFYTPNSPKYLKVVLPSSDFLTFCCLVKGISALSVFDASSAALIALRAPLLLVSLELFPSL